MPPAVFRRLLFFRSASVFKVRLSADFLHNLASPLGCKALQPLTATLVRLLLALVPRARFPPHYLTTIAATPPCAPRKFVPLRCTNLLRCFGAFNSAALKAVL